MRCRRGNFCLGLSPLGYHFGGGRGLDGELADNAKAGPIDTSDGGTVNAIPPTMQTRNRAKPRQRRCKSHASPRFRDEATHGLQPQLRKGESLLSPIPRPRLCPVNLYARSAGGTCPANPHCEILFLRRGCVAEVGKDELDFGAKMRTLESRNHFL